MEYHIIENSEFRLSVYGIFSYTVHRAAGTYAGPFVRYVVRINKLAVLSMVVMICHIRIKYHILNMKHYII